MTDYGHVGVLMGGWSEEREISLISGQNVLEALKTLEVQASGVDLRRETLPELEEMGLDCCFMALHGIGGEDGEVQQVLEEMGLPYTGSGPKASRRCMHKMMTKELWWQQELPTPKAVLAQADTLQQQAEELRYPLVVKPVDQGSSIGVELVHEPEALVPAVREASLHGCGVMLERMVIGTEYTVGILAGEALPMIRLRPTREFFDFEAKYESTETGYDIPCGLPEVMERELQDVARRAFECTGAHGYGRVDLILDELDRPWLLEINTAPGLRRHSLLSMAAQAVGLSYEDLIVRMLETSRICEGGEVRSV